MEGISALHWLIFIVILAILAAIYFIPTFVAFGRSHRHRVAIALFNLVLGWSGIGWVAALVWALIGGTSEGRTPV